ncbi:hypothetical protein [Kineococcus sp. SYSU DK003]|uniref:hypothetical protein n=1 Tax=Kineococcus sp. SYSU DK003 TaxID=3383124 RepID=UPI003D7C585F
MSPHRGRARQVGDPGAPQRSGYVPPGWPAQVLPPAIEDWELSAVAWILGHGAPEWHLPEYETLRRHPLMLTWWFRQWAQANLQAARASWQGLREVQQAPDPDAHRRHLAAVTAVGRDLRAQAHAAELIERAMLGELFVPRL